MPQSDRTELILFSLTLFIAIVFGLIIGVGDRIEVGRIGASLTPDSTVLFSSEVVAGGVLCVAFLGMVVGAKLLFDS